MRLATFNILHGRSLADGRVDLDRLREAVRALDPDILALQEVDRDQPRSHLADLTAVAGEAMGAISQRFAAALSGTPGATWIAATERDVPGEASYGVALLSRYPALSWQVLRLPRIKPTFPMWLRGRRRVIMVREEPRAVVIGLLDTPAGPVTVANTHLSFVPGLGRHQLRRIVRDLGPVAAPVVLLGDLNMTEPIPTDRAGYTRMATHPTFPADEPTEQLDHILLRGELGRVLVSQARQFELSDHRALVVELEPAS